MLCVIIQYLLGKPFSVYLARVSLYYSINFSFDKILKFWFLEIEKLLYYHLLYKGVGLQKIFIFNLCFHVYKKVNICGYIMLLFIHADQKVLYLAMECISHDDKSYSIDNIVSGIVTVLYGDRW